MSLIVVGPTQSGKTCLAVGLANTKIKGTDTFVVTPRGDVTRAYLGNRLKEFAESKWPGGTTESKTLAFDFMLNGRTEGVSFEDYKGETSTSPKFLEKLSDLGKNDGVILLVNPGFQCPYVEDANGNLRLATEADEKSKTPIHYVEAFKEERPFAKQWLVDQETKYAQIIERIRTRNGASKEDMPIVALVVTASDRLEENGDLCDCRPRFEGFLEKITDMLSGFVLETYRVSVTGHLDDQKRPQLADGTDNTSAEPFLGIIRKLTERDKSDKEEEEARKRKAKKKKVIKIVVGIAFAAVICVGISILVKSNHDQGDIATWQSACISQLHKTAFRMSDLKKAVETLALLRSHKGFCAARATAAADKLEPSIWGKQKFLIDRKVLEISESQGMKGGVQELAEVEELFSAFKPTLTNLVDEYCAHHANWKTQKARLEAAHQEYELREVVEKPLRGAERLHGISAMDKLYPIADVIRRLNPSSERLALVKDELAKKVDTQISAEWHNFAIPSFQKEATSNATENAVKAFRQRLDDWTPVSTSGEVAKSNLLAFVSTNAPFWRSTYEKATFSSEVDVAVKSGSLESIAKLYPSRVATNGFLTAEFVETQWTKRAKPVFERECRAYLDDIVAKSAHGKARPDLANDYKTDVERRATSVGAPFDSAKAQAYVEEHVKTKSQEWDSAKRDECKKWIANKIRPGRPRTGMDGLWSEYVQDKKRHDSNPFFVEIAGAAVYREVEQWFESDVDAFKKELAPAEGVSLWQDSANFAARYKTLEDTFENFKHTCLRVCEDKNPPNGTWAHRFAELCVTKGRVGDGINRAFMQRIVAKRLDAMIDYKKKFPVAFKHTSFAAWFEIRGYEKNGEPSDEFHKREILIGSHGEHAPDDPNTSISKDHEGLLKAIWPRPGEDSSEGKICEAGLFEQTVFVVKATDYNKWNGFKKTGYVINHVIPFARRQSSVEENGRYEMSGQLTVDRAASGAKFADIGVVLHADETGETPFTLLEQAKRETKNRTRQNETEH